VLKVLVFLVVFVIMLALPPLGFALLAFLGYTLYFYKKG
jgi:hypothetical protein